MNLSDINGFDLLDGASILCHYTNRTAEEDEKARQYLLEGPPDELVTESKVEFYDEQEVSSVEGKVSSADALEEGSRLESRTFVTFAINLLKIYCPDENADSLKKAENVFRRYAGA